MKLTAQTRGLIVSALDDAADMAALEADRHKRNGDQANVELALNRVEELRSLAIEVDHARMVTP